MEGAFLIQPSGNGQFLFVLKDDNNEILLRASDTYKTKQACKAGIESIRLHALRERNYTKYNDIRAKPTFYLRSINNHVIGLGESYNSMTARDKGIQIIKECAPGAPVVDEA